MPLLPENISQTLRLRLPSRRIYTDAEQQHDSAPLFVFGILGVPIILGLAVLPFWDYVGDWPLVASIDRVLAPAISNLPDVHQLTATRRRYLIGGSVLMYGIFLFQVMLLLLSKKRRFLLLEAYDLRRPRFYKAFLQTWFGVGLVWYILFFKSLEEAAKSPIIISVIAAQEMLFFFFPFLVALAGQMTTIAVLGIGRDAARFVRRFVVGRMTSG